MATTPQHMKVPVRCIDKAGCGWRQRRNAENIGKPCPKCGGPTRKVRSTSPDLPGEEWRPVVGFEEHYEISSEGRLRRTSRRCGSYAGRLVAGRGFQNGGYPAVGLSVGNVQRMKRVHILVAEAFLGPRPSPRHIVHHKDHNPGNPRASNLQWATLAENQRASVEAGRHVGCRKLTEDQVRAIYSDRTMTYQAQADQYGVTIMTVWNIRNDKSWRRITAA